MLDDNFYASLNQELSEDQKQALARNIYTELEDRVGEQLEAQLGEQKYEEFVTVIAKDDENELDSWLAVSVPQYEVLVDQTLETLKQEAKADPAKFLS
jgi:hypothetical protein